MLILFLLVKEKLIANQLIVRLYQVLQHVLNAKMFLLLPYVGQLVIFMIRYMGVTTIMSINQQAMDFKESKAYSKENLEAQMDHIIRLIKNIKGE
jgi:hypothetical protein